MMFWRSLFVGSYDKGVISAFSSSFSRTKLTENMGKARAALESGPTSLLFI